MDLSGRFVSLRGTPEAGVDSRFGPGPQAPVLYGRLCDGGSDKRLAFLVAHPSGNFLQHYLLGHLQGLGAACLAFNTRYVGNDTNLFMERAIQDVGVAVKFLRHEGYKRIVLIGNSGGGALAAFYQAEAERITVDSLPDGTPFELRAEDVPPVDALALVAAHPSRASVLTDLLDPSVIDESRIEGAHSDLDMFAAENGPPYEAGWLDRYRASQVARNHRITDLALSTLRRLEDDARAGSQISDLPLVVHRTSADPRFLDLAIDPDDRAVQDKRSVRASNYGHNSMARLSSLRSWLSQWSLRLTRADGPRCLERTSVPVFVARFSADGIVFPSQIAQWKRAAGDRAASCVVPGARHFMRDQVGLQSSLAKHLVDWARSLS